MDVGVVGGSGYAGAELLRLLAAHPTFKVTVVAAGAQAGRDLAAVFPHLGVSGALVASEPANLAACDVVFLATPHEASLTLGPALVDEGATVIDLSGAFRLAAAEFERWYGLAHPAPQLTPGAYGLPELFREKLSTNPPLVAVPGCYPTAALLALGPVAGLVKDDSIVVAGLSGTSGAGKELRDDLHASHTIGNVSPYGAPRHRHTPEIESAWAGLRGLGAPLPVSFTPHLVPVSRGLLCTVNASLADGVDAQSVLDRYHECYDDEPFVTVLPEGQWPATTHLVGSNVAHIGVAVDPRTGRVTASCAIDNLVKGAAGQAIQAANVACGLPETAGLPIAGVYP